MNDIKQMVQEALGSQVATAKAQYTSPEEYKEKTGKRFRLTKDEIVKFGSDPAGRLSAFNTRQAAGKL